MSVIKNGPIYLGGCGAFNSDTSDCQLSGGFGYDNYSCYGNNAESCTYSTYPTYSDVNPSVELGLQPELCVI
jgi:hypothetical protein